MPEEQTMNTHVPLRSILLATNLTDIEWLFPYTCSLAEESGAHVTVLHVIPSLNAFSIDLAGMPYYRPDEAIAEAKKHLNDFCTRTCTAKTTAEVVAVDGAPADAILATASQIHADLLVMGTRSNRGVDKWLHGSVAEAVLRSSPIPVITVGPHARGVAAQGRPIKSILFATSLKGRTTDIENANLTLRWAERLHGHLTLLHVVEGSGGDDLAQERRCEALERELRALVPEDAFRKTLVDARVRSGRPSREILTAATHTDLIALGALRSPVLGRFAPEGTLYKVLAEAHCPVVTLHSEHGKAKVLDPAKHAVAQAPETTATQH
jgi:nucleotide-binding universal stress UspA family protein